MQGTIENAKRSPKKFDFDNFLNTKSATVILPAIATVVLFIVWEVAVWALQIKPFNLPAPSKILEATIKFAPQLVAPESSIEAAELFHTIQHQQESVFTMEDRMPTIDGRLIDVFVGMARHTRESDQQTFYVTALTDITRRKTAERGLAQALQELQSLYRALPDIYFLMDSEQRFLQCYTAAPEQLFMPPEQFIGKTFADVLPPSFAEPFLRLFSQAQDSGQLCTHEYTLPIRGAEQHFEARLFNLNSSSSIF